MVEEAAANEGPGNFIHVNPEPVVLVNLIDPVPIHASLNTSIDHTPIDAHADNVSLDPFPVAPISRTPVDPFVTLLPVNFGPVGPIRITPIKPIHIEPVSVNEIAAASIVFRAFTQFSGAKLIHWADNVI